MVHVDRVLPAHCKKAYTHLEAWPLTVREPEKWAQGSLGDWREARALTPLALLAGPFLGTSPLGDPGEKRETILAGRVNSTMQMSACVSYARVQFLKEGEVDLFLTR